MSSNADEYAEATNRLTLLYIEDQKDRENPNQLTTEMLVFLTQCDEQRRKIVSELFARGCLKSADDYNKAALIFQHGTIPEHYYQALI